MPPTPVPRDCLLPAALWTSFADLDPFDIASFLAMWVGADRDGVFLFDPAALAKREAEEDLRGFAERTLRAGLAVIYAAKGSPRRACGEEGCGLPVIDTPSGTTCDAGHGGAPVVMTDRVLAAWLPDVPLHAPPPALKRPVEPFWPAPPPAAVRRILAARLKRAPTEAECRQASPRTYGGKRAAAPPTDDHVARAFAAWAAGQERPPERCSPVSRRLIESAMKEAGGTPAEAADALALLFRYVYEADEKGPRYLRESGYIGLDNLTVLSKIQSRLAAARRWADANTPPDGTPPGEEGVNLGPLARFRS